jgi:hypothetical protein
LGAHVRASDLTEGQARALVDLLGLGHPTGEACCGSELEN